MSHQIVTGQVDQPAAGADWKFTPSTSDHVRLLTVTAQLATAVAVANRLPALAFEDQNGLTYWSADTVVPQAASLTVRYSWSRNMSLSVASAVVTGERISAGMPDEWLLPGDTVSSVTAAIAAADQWSSIVWRGIVGDSWEDDRMVAAITRAFRGASG